MDAKTVGTFIVGAVIVIMGLAAASGWLYAGIEDSEYDRQRKA